MNQYYSRTVYTAYAAVGLLSIQVEISDLL